MRGKRSDGLPRLGRRGLIPACAGKTWPARNRTRRQPAHPRVCGENRSASSRSRRAPGSSPRVRGKPAECPVVDALRGLIPACAGKTPVPVSARFLPGAHPRVCGENGVIFERENPAAGSSPRVRGKRLRRRHVGRTRRLIPACAGKTIAKLADQTPMRAHPRVCGENPPAAVIVSATAGSSPRVRGKRSRRSHRPPSAGLIPACAGKTDGPGEPPAGPRAHPRVCGENSLFMY